MTKGRMAGRWGDIEVEPEEEFVNTVPDNGLDAEGDMVYNTKGDDQQDNDTTKMRACLMGLKTVIEDLVSGGDAVAWTDLVAACAGTGLFEGLAEAVPALRQLGHDDMEGFILQVDAAIGNMGGRPAP